MAGPSGDDAALGGLALSGIDIGTFDPATTQYAADVAHEVSSTTVTATPSDAAASVVVADADGSTAGTTRTVSLAEGANAISVTAADAATTRTYTVTVTRASAPLTAAFEDVPATHDGVRADAALQRGGDDELLDAAQRAHRGGCRQRDRGAAGRRRQCAFGR